MGGYGEVKMEEAEAGKFSILKGGHLTDTGVVDLALRFNKNTYNLHTMNCLNDTENKTCSGEWKYEEKKKSGAWGLDLSTLQW